MNFKERLNGLDLFSGIAGNSLGLHEYIKTVAYCEQDRHAQAVLLSRMRDGDLENAPIWDDIATLDGTELKGKIDIIIGGFPCQDISVAGKGAGILEGKRSGLFFEIVRLAKEIQPPFLFLENVPAIRTRGLDTVIQELTQIGHDCRWTMLSASNGGAPHKRERWFLLANSNSKRLEGQREKPIGIEPKFNYIGDDSWWAIEPDVGRVVNGVSNRVDRIKRLGNAVVPHQAKTAFEILMGII